MPRTCSARLGPPNFNYNLPGPLTTKRASYGPIRSILKQLELRCYFFCVFYCRDSIKSALKPCAILHFRNSKPKIFPYKASHLQRSTRASKFQFQHPPPNQKELPTALKHYLYFISKGLYFTLQI